MSNVTVPSLDRCPLAAPKEWLFSCDGRESSSVGDAYLWMNA